MRRRRGWFVLVPFVIAVGSVSGFAQSLEPIDRHLVVDTSADAEDENVPASSSKVPEIPEVRVAGRDVQILLSQFFPNLDQYLQELIAQTDSLTVERKSGHMRVEIVFDLDGEDDVIRFKAKERSESKFGEIYQVTFDKNVRFDIAMNGDQIRLDSIVGINALVKLPLISDRVNFYHMSLETSKNELSVFVSTLGGLARFVGHANVAKREVYGLDWLATILANMRLFSF